MKIWTSEHIFNHPWETVVQAAWRKYPNPMNPAVIGTDVVERRVVDGVLRTHRLVSSKWYFPKWAQSLIGTANVCYASEHSEVDPGSRQMTLKTRNLTFCSYIAWDETLTYSPHPSDPERTLLKQEAVVTVQGVPLTNYMEDLLTNSISCNAGKVLLAFAIGNQVLINKYCWHPNDGNTVTYRDIKESLVAEDIVKRMVKKHPDLERTKILFGIEDEVVGNFADKGRQAIEWVISKLDSEVKGIASSAARSTDELLMNTRRSIDDITSAAKKSFDDLQSLGSGGGQSLPKF